MKCPHCNSTETKVVDKRDATEVAHTRRRRECLGCGKRFTTYEKIDGIGAEVIKKDGTKEVFDIEKVRVGIHKAFEKRPVTAEELDKLVADVEKAIMAKEKPVTTTTIGEIIVEKLKQVNDVAYTRFSSVYNSFQDAKIFKKEVEKLELNHSNRIKNPVC